jgi:Ca2+-binding RTX toxin-like protein
MEKTMADITGTESANSLNGTESSDTIKGLGGNDSIYGKAGDDVILGGSGNDSLYGDAGTDTVKGEDGNDIVKGGTGKAFLYGGSGDDSVFYNPTTSHIADVGDYLSPTLLKGESGNDTLNVYNDAKSTVGGSPVASTTNVYSSGNGVLQIEFTDKDWNYLIHVGEASGFETIKFNGAGGVNFQADFYSNSTLNVTGTAVADKFYSSYNSETITGGAGNDQIHIGGGNDKVISNTNDADSIYFPGGWDYPGDSTVQGFNGAGQQAGDKLYFNSSTLLGVTESGGNTVFSVDAGETLTIVGATGLIEGVDWFV